MPQATPRYHKNDRFVIRRFGQEGLLVPLQLGPGETGNLFSLNPLAMEIWENLEGRTFEELCRFVVENYQVSEETAAADLRDFLGQLEATGCLARGAAPPE